MAYEDPEVGASDLRLKLQRKESQQAYQRGKVSNLKVHDLREKLSGIMHSKPPNTYLPKAKAVSEAAKSVKKSAPSAEASIPYSKKVADLAPRKKQKVQVS